MIILILNHLHIVSFWKGPLRQSSFTGPKMNGPAVVLLQKYMTRMLLSYQRGQKPGVKLTEKACWP